MPRTRGVSFPHLRLWGGTSKSRVFWGRLAHTEEISFLNSASHWCCLVPAAAGQGVEEKRDISSRPIAPLGSRQGEVWCREKRGKDSARREGGAGRSMARAAIRAPLMGYCLETEACMHGPWEWRRSRWQSSPSKLPNEHPPVPGTVLGDGTKAKQLPLWHDVAS